MEFGILEFGNLGLSELSIGVLEVLSSGALAFQDFGVLEFWNLGKVRGRFSLPLFALSCSVFAFQSETCAWTPNSVWRKMDF